LFQTEETKSRDFEGNPNEKGVPYLVRLFCVRSFRRRARRGRDGLFAELSLKLSPEKLSGDGVYPTDLGNEYIACRRQERDSFGK